MANGKFGMTILTTFLLGLGLSMDCFAVSVTFGAKEKKQRLINVLKVALYFGTFQAIMPLIGWLAGFSLKGLISSVDHWIAFILLSSIGLKMIYESFKLKKDEQNVSLLNNKVLIMLSIATSIDALVIGISLAFLNINIMMAAIVIGFTAFFITLLGFLIGSKFNFVSGKKIEIIGGLVLIGIGLKTLVEHLTS